MEIEFGAEVIDKYGKTLGTVNHLMRNTWTGEISKFIVRRKAPDSDLLFSPQDVLEVTNDAVKLSLSIDELSERHKL